MINDPQDRRARFANLLKNSGIVLETFTTQSQDFKRLKSSRVPQRNFEFSNLLSERVVALKA